MIPDIDRIRGSLIGGAIGDALGYPVEFVRSYEKIQEKFGPMVLLDIVSMTQMIT